MDLKEDIALISRRHEVITKVAQTSSIFFFFQESVFLREKEIILCRKVTLKHYACQ